MIAKVIHSVRSLKNNKVQIVHRDFHSQNIMLHFPKIKPKQKDLEEPEVFYKEKMDKLIYDQVKDLKDPKKFQTKIIDYGFAKLFDAEDQVKIYTPNLGVDFVQAPEMYDENIDFYT